MLKRGELLRHVTWLLDNLAAYYSKLSKTKDEARMRQLSMLRLAMSLSTQNKEYFTDETKYRAYQKEWLCLLKSILAKDEMDSDTLDILVIDSCLIEDLVTILNQKANFNSVEYALLIVEKLL